MHEIAQLYKVLLSVSDKSNFIIKGSKKTTLEYQYLSGVLNNTFKSDQEAAVSLYGTSQADVRYKMLKHRIRKKLYLSLQNAELNSNHIILQKEQECLRLINLGKLFLKKLQFDIVLNLCNKIKSIALHYEFNDLILTAYEMESICLSNNGNLKQFLKTKAYEKQYLKLITDEREAIGLYQNAKILLKSTVKYRKIHLDELTGVLERLEKIWESTKSFDAYDAYFKTSIINFELTGNFKEIIRITEEAENYLKNGIVNGNRFNKRYNAYVSVYAHLRDKSIEKGLQYAEKFLPYFDESSLNWFSFMENYFLLAVHAKQYELASLLIGKVLASLHYKQIPKDSRERWQLYQAYLYFFNPNFKHLEDFNYQKFITSFAGYSKDKQGFNVAILILQYMYFLKRNDSEALLYRIESLKKYSSTHLKDINSLRSKLFLKLLMFIVTEDFDAEACRVKGAKNYQKLSETPTPGDAYAEIEIIPYEQLWEMILGILKKRD